MPMLELEEVVEERKSAVRGREQIQRAAGTGQNRAGSSTARGRFAKKMSELQYGRIPELEKQLAAASKV